MILARAPMTEEEFDRHEEYRLDAMWEDMTDNDDEPEDDGE